MQGELPLLIMMCGLCMVGAIVLRPFRLQLAALALLVMQVGMTIYYVAR